MQQPRYETFNSGILDVCIVKENKITADVAHGIRFQNKTVGVTRYWEAKVASSKIDRLISIPELLGISQEHFILLSGKQYRINQIQYKEDTRPRTMLLSLEQQVILRKDVRNGN